MTNYLYYSKTPSTLLDVGNSVCTTAMDENAVKKLVSANSHIKKPDKPSFKGAPFILPGINSLGCSLPMCSSQEHNRLKTLSYQIGGAATAALAELVDELKIPSYAGDFNTFGGNGIGAAAQVSGFMVKDIANYDRLLKEYYDLKNHRAAPATLIRKESELKRAFVKMNGALNKRGQQILHKHKSQTKQVLTQTGKVGYEPIPIGSHPDVQRLAKLAKFGKVAGPGFILLDGFFRYDNVAKMYQENNANWKREAVIQTAGFTTGILTGAAIVFVIGFAPVGLVVGVLAAGAAAVLVDKAATTGVGMIYDGLVQ